MIRCLLPRFACKVFFRQPCTAVDTDDNDTEISFSPSAVLPFPQLQRKEQFGADLLPAHCPPLLCLRRSTLQQQLQHQDDLAQLPKSLGFLGQVCCVASHHLQLPGYPSIAE